MLWTSLLPTKKRGPSHCNINLSSQLSLIPSKYALNTFQMTKQTGKAKTTKKERHKKIWVLPLKHQEHGFEFVSNA